MYDIVAVLIVPSTKMNNFTLSAVAACRHGSNNGY